MVEVGGVEPPSESTLTGLSPGADGYSGSLPPCSPSGRQAVTLARSGESHDAWAGQLFPVSRTPHKRRLPRPVASPVQTAALIRQQQQQCCCYLIYNCPFYGCQAHPPACPASIPPSKPVHPLVVGANCTHSVSVGKLSFAPTKTAYRFVAPPLPLETTSSGFSRRRTH